MTSLTRRVYSFLDACLLCHAHFPGCAVLHVKLPRYQHHSRKGSGEHCSCQFRMIVSVFSRSDF